MLQNQENFKNSSPVGFNKKINIEGLETFKKNIEKYFFSKVIIRNDSTKDSFIKLTIELNCNFSMIEMLHHFNNGNWGNFECKNQSFINLLQQLQNSNDAYIEVEEFSIFLKDTSLIINTIYNQSVPEQLEKILKKIGNHYVHFTNGLNRIPYEIYVPVFEENTKENYSEFLNSTKVDYNENDFFSYWGLYFYSEEEAEIYDLETLSIISGKLQMLNRD